MTTKIVLKVEVLGEKEKKKALRALSSASGVETVKMETKEKKMTVVGDVDPIEIAAKLWKHCHAEILSVGLEKKKEEPKKEDPKKTDAEKTAELLELSKIHYPTYSNRACNYSPCENPNSCCIC